MRAISPNRQTGVLPHGFSRLEYLAQARSPPKSTQGSAGPLLFGQDLVKVSASHFEPATFALATNPSGMHEPSGCSPNRHDPAISLGSAASTESLSRYPGVSPFPLALLDYQLGLMWMNEGRLEDARRSFEAARRLVLAFAPAQGHLAEAEAEAGECDSAVARLRPLALSSDDPDYAAQLARILGAAGHDDESRHWRRLAAARFDEPDRESPGGLRRPRRRILARCGRRSGQGAPAGEDERRGSQDPALPPPADTGRSCERWPLTPASHDQSGRARRWRTTLRPRRGWRPWPEFSSARRTRGRSRPENTTIHGQVAKRRVGGADAPLLEQRLRPRSITGRQPVRAHGLEDSRRVYRGPDPSDRTDARRLSLAGHGVRIASLRRRPSRAVATSGGAPSQQQRQRSHGCA